MIALPDATRHEVVNDKLSMVPSVSGGYGRWEARSKEEVEHDQPVNLIMAFEYVDAANDVIFTPLLR